MAVSNTVGNNTFDVLLCLGVPWLIKAAAWNAPIEISSRGLFVSCFFIVGSVAIAFFVLYLNNWVLNQKVGCIFIVIYFIFLGTSGPWKCSYSAGFACQCASSKFEFSSSIVIFILFSRVVFLGFGTENVLASKPIR